VSADRGPVRQLDTPEAGYFLLRLVRRGPFVPCAITNIFGLWQAVINGETMEPAHEDPIQATGVCRVWNYHRERINRVEYDRLLGLKKNPAHPANNPQQAVDVGAMAPLF
jgi:hypothetical protein